MVLERVGALNKMGRRKRKGEALLGGGVGSTLGDKRQHTAGPSQWAQSCT